MPTKKAKKNKAAKKKSATPTRKAAKKKSATPARNAAKKKSATPARKAARKKVAAPRKASPKARGASARGAKKARAAAPKTPAKKAKKTLAKAAKPAAKKAAVLKTATSPAARAKPIQRRDHAGHIDPKYAAELREKSSPREEDPSSFVEGSHSKDNLVEELAEEYVQSATSAEYKAEDAMNADVSEEVGGPFVETAGGTEFAPGTDASNPKSATREPFPRT